MNRRAFFSSALAAGACATLPLPDAKPLRTVHKWTVAGWERCRMYELATGDLFRLGTLHNDVYDYSGVFCAEGMPYKQPDGTWGIVALERQSDPEQVAV